VATHNDITGDALISKTNTDAYRDNYDAIFRKPKEESFFEIIHEARKVIVDPPSGWQYGFPTLWDKDEYEKLEDFLKAKGYPEDQIEFACRHMRMWLPQEENKDGDNA
jgi:hypothetical protein